MKCLLCLISLVLSVVVLILPFIQVIFSLLSYPSLTIFLIVVDFMLVIPVLFFLLAFIWQVAVSFR